MNKHRFRIIFNTTRGLMMVVAEYVKSHMAGAESTHNSQTEIQLIKPQDDTSVPLRPLAFCLMCAFGLVVVVPNPFNMATARAEAIAAGNVPGNQQPTIIGDRPRFFNKKFQVKNKLNHATSIKNHFTERTAAYYPAR